MSESKDFKFDVFISYKHAPRDMKIAAELQKKLERFRVPREIRKKSGKKRIKRVFRDQEELAAGNNLQEEIENQLRQSEFLVLLCSKESRQSIWVARELDTFLRYHPIDHVLPVLISGEPVDSYPIRLLEAGEFFGADVRAESDRKALARLKHEMLKILAPVLYCSYDELVQRHKRRQARELAAASMVLLGASVAFSGYVLTKNQEIQKAYRETQISEAQLLANRAQEELEAGNSLGAIEYALESLPSESDPEMPVIPATQRILIEAMNLYKAEDDDLRYNTVGVYRAEDEANGEFIVDASGKYLLLRETRRLRVIDTERMECIRTIDTSGYAMNRLDENALISGTQVVVSNGNDLYVYDFVTGEQVLHISFTGDIKCTRVARDQKTLYAMVDEQLAVADLEKGMITSYFGYVPDENKKLDSVSICDLKVSDDGNKVFFVMEGEYEGEDNVFNDTVVFDMETQEFTRLSRETHDHGGRSYRILLRDGAVYVCGYGNYIGHLTTYASYIPWDIDSDDDSKSSVELAAYDPASGNVLWEEEYPIRTGNGDCSAEIEWRGGDDISGGGSLVLYCGATCFYIDPVTGNRILDMDLGENIRYLSKKSKVAFTCRDGRLVVFDFAGNTVTEQKTLPGGIEQMAFSEGFLYCLSQDGKVTKYKYEMVDPEAKLYCHNEEYYYGLQYDYKDGCLVAFPKYYYTDEKTILWKGREDEALIPFVLPEDNDNKIDKIELLEFHGETGVFLAQYRDQTRGIITIDFEKNEISEEKPDLHYNEYEMVFNDRKVYVPCVVGYKGIIKAYDRTTGKEEQFVYNNVADPTYYWSDDLTSLLVIDVTNLTCSVVDVAGMKCVKVLSIADWNREDVEIMADSTLEKKNHCGWSRDGSCFFISSQNNINIYNKSGKLLSRIPCMSESQVLANKNPAGFFSPDHKYFYYILGEMLYQVETVSGTCLNSQALTMRYESETDIQYEFAEDRLYLMYGGVLNIISVNPELFGTFARIEGAFAIDTANHEILTKMGIAEKNYYLHKEYELERLVELGRLQLGGEAK